MTVIEAPYEKLDNLHYKWDRRFFDLANLVSTWSKDPSTKCGAVIVRPDKTIASVGYNGFPRGCDDSPEIYENRELKYERVVHAECNAILNARERLDDYKIYTWPAGYGPTCSNCAKHIIQSGISEVFHLKDESEFALRWKEQAEIGLQMYAESGVQVWSFPVEEYDNNS